MQRRTFVATSVGALVAVSATAQDGSLAARASGVWSLVEAKTIAGDAVTSWFGRKEPISGLLIYTATGWMSVQITGARLATPSRAEYEALPDGEKSAWLEAYYAAASTSTRPQGRSPIAWSTRCCRTRAAWS